jgi:hypothetical protein
MSPPPRSRFAAPNQAGEIVSSHGGSATAGTGGGRRSAGQAGAHRVRRSRADRRHQLSRGQGDRAGAGTDVERRPSIHSCGADSSRRGVGSAAASSTGTCPYGHTPVRHALVCRCVCIRILGDRACIGRCRLRHPCIRSPHHVHRRSASRFGAVSLADSRWSAPGRWRDRRDGGRPREPGTCLLPDSLP